MEATATVDTSRKSYHVLGFKRSLDPTIAADSKGRKPRAVEIKVDTAGSLQPEIRTPWSIPKVFFEMDKGRLKALKPVAISIGKGEELWFAENEHVDVFATGETVDKAVDEFSRHLVHFYHHYMSLPEDQAVGDARRLKRLFEGEFVESDK